MGKLFKLIGHSSALKVNNEKSDVIRVKQGRHGQYIGLENLAFSGTGRTGYKSVGAVGIGFIADIQKNRFSLFLNAQRSRHALINQRLFPPCADIQI